MAAGVPADPGILRRSELHRHPSARFAYCSCSVSRRWLPGSAGRRRRYQISVNVDLVVLNATVRDRQGRVVPDLREQDFEVYEDGVRQAIRLFRHEDIPVTVGLVIDHSGSMRQKLPHVIAAARTFVQSSSPEDQMFVVNFNENVTLGLPDAIPSPIAPRNWRARSRTRRPTGKTALYDAVVAARGALADRQPRQEGADRHQRWRRQRQHAHPGRSFADGGAIERSRVHDRHLRPGGSGPESRPCSGAWRRRTGGEAFFPGDLDEVVAICERIARDIRNQYTLGYVSSNAARSGAWRTIRGDRRRRRKEQTRGAHALRIHRRGSRRPIEAVDSRLGAAHDCRRDVDVVRIGGGGRLDVPARVRAAGSIDCCADTPRTACPVAENACHRSRPAVSIGRLEISRLGLSVIVIEGTGTTTLRRAAGHIAGTALPGEPGNVGISGHRDTFFRPLRNIRKNDIITLTTLLGEYRYRVVSTTIVGPSDVERIGAR